MSEKVIILTGASRGIGLAIAHYLLQNSHNLVITARSAAALESIKATAPDHVQILVGDAADLSLGEKAVKLALDTWNRLDGLIVNHGVLDPVKKVADSSAEEWRSAFDINVFSAVGMVQAALPSLRKSKGRIILTSSGAAVSAYTGWGAYGASKAVLNHLASTLAVEEPDVTTVSVRPGVVDTEMQREIREKHHEAMDQQDAKKFKEFKSGGSLLKPEQPGHVIAKLAVEAPAELSGRFLSWNDNDLAAFQA